MLSWFFFETKAGDLVLAAFERVTGFAFEFPRGRLRLVAIQPERAVFSGLLTFAAALLALVASLSAITVVRGWLCQDCGWTRPPFLGRCSYCNGTRVVRR